MDVLLLAYNGKYNESDQCRKGVVQSTGHADNEHVRRKTGIHPNVGGVVEKKLRWSSARKPYSEYAGDQTWKSLQRKQGHNWYAAVLIESPSRGWVTAA